MISKTHSKIKPAARARRSGAKNFRRLNWNEQVRRGDYVEDDKQGFELWAGMVGFQADSFVKAIYRRKKTAPLK